MAKIYLDAGHNNSGDDSGAVGNGLREQDINFLVADKLAALLNDYGIHVMMSRGAIGQNLGNSVPSSLAARYNAANAWGADYFVSIHCNASTNASASGSEVYCYSLSGKGFELAKKIQGALVSGLGTVDRGVKARSDFAVLKNTKMPAVLVELAFISNASDAAILKDRQGDLAEALLIGILGQLGIAYRGSTAASAGGTSGGGEVCQCPCGEVSHTVSEASSQNLSLSPVYTHERIGDTEVVFIEPLAMRGAIINSAKIPFHNGVSGGYFMQQAVGGPALQGILVSEGCVLSNNQPHGKPCGTVIVRRDGSVYFKPLLNILEESDVWFAVSGCSILPDIRMNDEGFVGAFADVGRVAARPVLGFNSEKNKIVVAVRGASSIQRGQLTLKNLNCDFGITLDGGGSVKLRVAGRDYFSGDRVVAAALWW